MSVIVTINPSGPTKGHVNREGRVDEADTGSATAAKLQNLHDVTREMMRARTRSVLFETVTETAAQLLEFEYSTIRRHDVRTDRLVPVAVSSELSEQTGDRRVYYRGDTVQWRAIDDGEILVFQEVSEISDEADRPGDGSMMVVPLEGFGVLTLGSPEPKVIGQDDVQLAAVFGANVEAAIERVERLQKLNEREDQLRRRAQQSTVMNRVLRHNIRNELNKLLGYQTELRDVVEGTNEQYLEESIESIRTIDSWAETARDIQSVLSDDVRRTTLDLASLAREQAVRAHEEFDDVSIRITVPEAAPVRVLDRLDEGVWELVENAVVHNDDTPRLCVTVETGETCRLTIADDGPGIPDEERQVIEAGDERELRHGSGLGLWYLSWLVDHSDGNVQFTESPFASGTAVTLTFDRAE